MSTEEKDEETTPGFMKASEYTPDQIAVMQTNFQNFFQWILEQARTNAPEGHGISVKADIGPHSAEITYSPPPVSQDSRQRRQPQPKVLNLVGAQGVVSEYPDFLTPPEDAETFWFVGTKKKLGDEIYKAVNQKLRDNGFKYERWVQGKAHTGGWKANK